LAYFGFGETRPTLISSAKNRGRRRRRWATGDMGRNRILVIKLGALGDFVQAFAAFAQIRQAHVDAEITLLTTPPFAAFAAASGLFDLIETDGRPKGLWALARLVARLRGRRYRRVYDLQTSGRSKRYFYAFLPRPPEWSGISPGASHRQIRRDRDLMHNLDRMADQLHAAGIGPVYAAGEAPPPRFDWAIGQEDVAAGFGLSAPFALLAPAASPVKPQKRWPIEQYSALAAELAGRGFQIGVVGGPEDRPLFDQIAQVASGAVDLTGRTSLVQLAALGGQAALAVGNDTGPTHLLAYAGAPGLMLMSSVSRPEHCGPRASMGALQVDDLRALDCEAVIRRLEQIGALA
jgi:ADP-heptose:LPS heptosyltransferase